MESHIRYSNHIKHYKVDGEYYDFLEPDKFMIQNIRRRYQEFLNLYKVKENDKILEIGSGGSFIIEFLKNNINYYPLDIPINNLKRIKETSKIPILPISADGYFLPFKENSFNLIILSEVLEHLAEPDKVLQQIHRVLNKNGKCLISVPYKEKISYQICVHCNKPTPINAHIHSFDEKTLSLMTKKAGLNPNKLTKNCNKISHRLHLNVILKFLPYPIWKLMDIIFNFFFDKPASLILLSTKS